ncbi:MAG: PBP1A family penicillin-binding protein [Clostridium perfringens]|nr:PBP1A family penicillin-binding protein [Clostridium perfringens]
MSEKNSTFVKKDAKFKKIFKKILLVFSIVIIILITSISGYAFAVIKSAPALDVEAILEPTETTTLYDDEGNFVTNYVTRSQRYVVDSSEIPDNLKNAYVSIEDERFYEHKGIDVKRILGAVVNNVKTKLQGKSTFHGGSTLTQQLIKNTLLTDESTITRKIKEAYLALGLERELGKDEILTTYLNTIPLGGYVYGVQAASVRFFSKDVSELNLIESAYIAGITQAPSTYDALSSTNQEDPSRYIKRTKTVLGKMLELGYITDSEYNQGISDLDNGLLEFTPSSINNEMQYEWFTRPATDQVINDLMENLKYTEDEAKSLIANGGLKIYTTMDTSLQDSVQEILDTSSNYTGAFKGGVETVDENGIPKLQAAASIMDYRTGEVKALIGGRGDQPQYSLNRAYDTLKSIGSTTKPLTVYAPAIDLKILGASSIMSDSPLTSDEIKKAGYNGSFQPQNESRSYNGNITVRQALRISSNVVAVKTITRVGLNNSISYGEKFDLIFGENSRLNASSVALGQFTNDPEDPDGSNVFNLAAAYGTFGNDGVKTEPILYTKVLDRNGNVLIDNTAKTTQVISAETAYILYDMLKEPLTYSAQGAKVTNIPTSGKTGTTTSNKDYWFAGLTPYYSAAVWIGYGDNTVSMNGGAGRVAAPLWGKIMNAAHEGLSYKEITGPNSTVSVTVCDETGLLPTSTCLPDVHSEIFSSGTEPTTYCTGNHN